MLDNRSLWRNVFESSLKQIGLKLIILRVVIHRDRSSTKSTSDIGR
jgi:hypothetical protein